MMSSSTERKRAIKKIEKYCNKDISDTEQAREHMNRENGILNHRELESFAEMQLCYGSRLAIAPMAHEEHMTCKESKEEL